jgi:hypothetical protein
MVRCFVAMMIAGLCMALPVRAQGPAQTPETDDNPRYQFSRVEDGYLRLDLKSGQVSSCNRRTVGWSCLAVPDDRVALDGEIARLQGENAALKKVLLDHGLPLPGGIAATPPVAQGGGDTNSNIKLPSNADVDRVMAVVERVWRRLVEMIVSLQKDIMKKT